MADKQNDSMDDRVGMSASERRGRSPTSTNQRLSSTVHFHPHGDYTSPVHGKTFSASYHPASSTQISRSSGAESSRSQIQGRSTTSGMPPGIDLPADGGARPKAFYQTSQGSSSSKSSNVSKMDGKSERTGPPAEYEADGEWQKCLMIKIMLQFKLALHEKEGIPQSYTERIPVDYPTYLKWKLIERCSILASKTSNVFSERNIGFIFENNCTTLTFGTREEAANDMAALVQWAVEKIGERINLMKPVELSENLASELVQQLRNTKWAHQKITYVEVIDGTRVCVAGYGKTAIEDTEEVVNRFCKQIPSSRNCSTCFSFPAFMEKVFEYCRVKDIQRSKYPDVKLGASRHGDNYHVTLTGLKEEIDDARMSLSQINDQLIASKKLVYLNSEQRLVLKELNLEPHIQQCLDDKCLKCAVVQTGDKINLYGFSCENLTNVAIEVGKMICHNSILLIGQWREKFQELKGSVSTAINGPYVVKLMDGARLHVMGLSPFVEKVEKYIEGIMSYDSRGNRPQHDATCSESFIVKSQDSVQMTASASELKPRYKVKVTKGQAMRSEKEQGLELIIQGQGKAVMTAVSDMKIFRSLLVSDTFSYQACTEPVHHFFRSAEGHDFIKKLEKEYSVGISTQDTSSLDSGRDGHSQDKGVPNAIMSSHGNSRVWQFDDGYSLQISTEPVSSHRVKVVACLKMQQSDEGHLSKPLRSEAGLAVEVKLPRWCGGKKNEIQTFESLIKRVLDKVDGEAEDSIALTVCEMYSWNKTMYLQSLLLPLVQHMVDGQTQPKTVVVCSSDEEVFLKAVDEIQVILQKFPKGEVKRAATKMQVQVVEGKLHETKADVLVNTTSASLDLNHGKVSKAILNGAGPEIQKECWDKFPNGLSPKEIVVTKGYNLRCKAVFHGAIRKYNKVKELEAIGDLRHFLQQCLQEADTSGFRSIAFPAIGSGNLRFPADLVACEMFSAAERWRTDHVPSSLQHVYFVIFPLDKSTLQEFKKIEDDLNELDAVSGRTIGTSFTLRGSKEDVQTVKWKLTEKVDQLMVEKENIPDVSRGVFKAFLHFHGKEVDTFVERNGVKMEYKNCNVMLEGAPGVLKSALDKMSDLLKQTESMRKHCVNLKEESHKLQALVQQYNKRYPKVCIVFDPINTVLTFFSNTKDDLDKVKSVFLKELSHSDSYKKETAQMDKTADRADVKVAAGNFGQSKEDKDPLATTSPPAVQARKQEMKNVSGGGVNVVVNKVKAPCGVEQDGNDAGYADISIAGKGGNSAAVMEANSVGRREDDAVQGRRDNDKREDDAVQGRRENRREDDAVQGRHDNNVGKNGGAAAFTPDSYPIAREKGITYMAVRKANNSKHTSGDQSGSRKEDSYTSGMADNSAVGGMANEAVLKVTPSFVEDKGTLKCTFTKYFTVKVFTGSILDVEKVQTVVCSEDQSGKAAGMIAKELLRKGGNKYKEEKQKLFQDPPPLGEVVTTCGGRNTFENIIHALIPMNRSSANIKKMYARVFQEAVTLNSKTLAISLLATGVGGEDPRTAGGILYDSCFEFSQTHMKFPLVVHVVNNDKVKTQHVVAVFKESINQHSIDLPSAMVQLSREQAAPPSVGPAAKTINVKNVMVMVRTNETGPVKETPGPAVTATEMGDTEDYVDSCVICMDEAHNPEKLRCGHIFCKDCIEQYFKVKKACPTCGKVCGEILGDQPDGSLEVTKMIRPVAGYRGTGSLMLCYIFPDGRQGPDHPHPGTPYKGIKRAAYLPDTDEGRRICAMMMVAFQRRLVFTIGFSRTTGKDGVITWNDIHHKTDPRPNTQFGYPDPSYLSRVKDELAAKGVTEKDVKQRLLNEMSQRADFHEKIDLQQ